ncbi:unnamed protein product, partial [Nesidiocoris tenuis]
MKILKNSLDPEQKISPCKAINAKLRAGLDSCNRMKRCSLSPYAHAPMKAAEEGHTSRDLSRCLAHESGQ